MSSETDMAKSQELKAKGIEKNQYRCFLCGSVYVTDEATGRKKCPDTSCILYNKLR